MLVFISGSINSGKSTIADLLSKNISRSAVVDIDKLSEFISWLPIEEKTQLNLENGASLIDNFLKQGFNVIVPYPLSKDNYNFLLERIDLSGQKVYFFVLNPDLEIALSNRGSRELTEGEVARIKHHYERKINNPGFGEVIDNSRQSPEETVDLIMSLIK